MDSKIVSYLFQGVAVVCMGGIDGTVTYPFALYFSNYLRERRPCREPLNSRYFFYYPFLTQQKGTEKGTDLFFLHLAATSPSVGRKWQL